MGASDTPVAEDTNDRFRIKLISAVRTLGGIRLRLINGRINSDKFIGYLKNF